VILFHLWDKLPFESFCFFIKLKSCWYSLDFQLLFVVFPLQSGPKPVSDKVLNMGGFIQKNPTLFFARGGINEIIAIAFEESTRREVYRMTN